LDIHKPKPVHSIREFLSEIAVVVCGILIALSLEQCLELWRTHERIEAGDASIRAEISDQLAYATLFLKLKPELDARVDALEAAAVTGNHAQAARLAGMAAPLITRPWSTAGWEAAASEQVVSRLDPGRRRLYEVLHRQANAMLELQWRVKENYAVLLGARWAAAGNAGLPQEIAAAERIRSDSVSTAQIGASMLREGEQLGLHPTLAQIRRGPNTLSDCPSSAVSAAAAPQYVC